MKGKAVVVAFLGITLTLALQTSAQSDVVTNADVIKLVEAKLSEDLVVTKIKVSRCDCDTSVDAILKLKSAGVSDAVIRAMVDSSNAATKSGSSVPAVSSSSASPVPMPLSDPNALVTVREFKPTVDFPYDFKQLQIQTVIELKKRRVPAGDGAGVYRLEGEVVEWNAGNRATRLIIGLGSGRESAKIHYWLTDQNGTKVFEATDTIRQSVWGGGSAPSSGQLVQPFAIKIAERIAESRPVKR